MIISGIERTEEQVADRIEQLLAWDKLVIDTWGDADFSPKYSDQRNEVFAEGADPFDAWNSPFDLDEILGEWK